MPNLSTKPTTPSYNVRSISFPARSHPSIRKIEEKLNDISSLDVSFPSSIETIRARLASLGEIYKSIEDLLSLPLTQQALLARNQEEKWVCNMLEDLMSFLDICGNTRDTILLMQESIREVKSALRRSKGGGGDLSNIVSTINAYISSRKRIKKESSKSLARLKQKERIFGESSNYILNSNDNNLVTIVKAIRETSSVTISVINSLLTFISMPFLKPKNTKWALISRLVHKGGNEGFEDEEDDKNELEKVDLALGNLLVGKDLELKKVQFAEKMLEFLDTTMEDFEKGLECLFRHLIHIRVSLLNIVSNQLD